MFQLNVPVNWRCGQISSVRLPSLDVRSRTPERFRLPASALRKLPASVHFAAAALSLEVLLICHYYSLLRHPLIDCCRVRKVTRTRYTQINLPSNHDRSTFTPLFCSGGITSIWIRRSCQYWNGPKGKFLSIGNSAPNEC